MLLLNSDEWGRNYPTLLDKTNFLGLDRNSLHNLALLDKSKLCIIIHLLHISHSYVHCAAEDRETNGGKGVQTRSLKQF